MYTVDPDQQWRYLLFRTSRRAREWEQRREREQMKEGQNES
jgi:hypothetical protein